MIYVLLKICLSIWHIFINYSKHNFWNLRWIFDFQKCVGMRLILFTVFTIIKIFADTAFVSITFYWSNTTSIAFYIQMSIDWIILLRLLFINLIWIVFANLVFQIFFLFFNNTLDKGRWLLFQWFFDHFFNSFFLVFPKFFFHILRRFFTFFSFLSSFKRLSIGNLLLKINFFFRARITWTLILFIRKIFTVRFFLIFFLRLRLRILWNLEFLFLNKIFEKGILINTIILIHWLIFQVTFLSDRLIWQDFEFKISIALVFSPIISS